MTERQNDRPLVPDTGAYNDAIADIYDSVTAGEAWLVNDLVAQRLQDYPRGNLSVLDLGAGTGQTVGTILDSVHASRIVAVDASHNMLTHLRNQHPSPVVEVIEDSIESYTQYNRDTFDIITAIGSLEFVKDLPAVLGRLALHLRSDGLLMATYVQRDEAGETERTFRVPSLGQAFTEYYWDPGAIRGSLASEGLEVTEEFLIPAYQRGDEMVEYAFMSAIRPREAK